MTIYAHIRTDRNTIPCRAGVSLIVPSQCVQSERGHRCDTRPLRGRTPGPPCSVRAGGLEPPRQRHWNLNPARLPIPPRPPAHPVITSAVMWSRAGHHSLPTLRRACGDFRLRSCSPPPGVRYAPSFSRRRATWPVALTLYWASSTAPCSSTTTVDRIRPSCTFP